MDSNSNKPEKLTGTLAYDPTFVVRFKNHYDAGLNAEEVRNFTEAQFQYMEALQYIEYTVSDSPANAAVIEKLAEALHKVGFSSEMIDDLDEACSAYSREIDVLEQLASLRPDDFYIRLNIAFACDHIAELCVKTGFLKQAHLYYERALAEGEVMERNFPGDERLAFEPMLVLTELAKVYEKLKDPEGAIKCHRRLAAGSERDAYEEIAREHSRRAQEIEEHPELIRITPDGDPQDMFDDLYDLGCKCEKAKDHAKALEYFERALPFIEELAKNAPQDVSLHQLLAYTLFSIGCALRYLGKLEQAKPVHERELRVLELLIKLAPDNWHVRDMHVWGFDTIASLCKEMGLLDETLIYYERCLSAGEQLAKDFPDNADEARSSIEISIVSLIEFLEKTGKLDQSRTYCLRYIEILEQPLQNAKADDPVPFAAIEQLTYAYRKLASLYEQSSDLEQAQIYYKRLEELDTP